MATITVGENGLSYLNPNINSGEVITVDLQPGIYRLVSEEVIKKLWDWRDQSEDLIGVDDFDMMLTETGLGRKETK